MDSLQHIIYGFGVLLTPTNVLYCFLGVLMGTLVGVLPGLCPAASISLLLPTVYHASPIAGFVMLAGVAYGAQYGGSTTSILLNIPGETSSVITCIDGYQMALHGRAGPALGIAAFGSVIGGTVGVLGIMLFAPPLANLALRFGPPEYFAIAAAAMTIIAYVSKGSVVESVEMACVGALLSTAGLDPLAMQSRFTFGLPNLLNGFEMVFVAVGLFGLSEVLINLDQSLKPDFLKTKIKNILPTRQDWKDSAKPIARGSILGFFMGIIPGIGMTISTFISYALERRLSKHPERFGTGAIEGVAGPETANNSASSGTFIPLLSLGIPTTPSTAILVGALIVLGVQPGPLLIGSNPDLFWGLIASMYIGNVMLLVLNLPLIGVWVQVLKVPYSILGALIVIFCEVGAYSINNSTTGVLIMNIFGLGGYFMKRYGFPAAPLIIGLVLGPLLETSLRRSLIMSKGSLMIFFSRPISAVFLLIAIACLISPLFSRRGVREKLIKMEEKA